MYPTWPSEELHVPCWDKECEKKQERWEEAVNSIDFLHSSRKAWSTINKLTGRSGRSSRVCPISANSILPTIGE